MRNESVRIPWAGGDFGSVVMQLLALAHPESVVGIHVTDLSFYTVSMPV